MRSKMYYSIHNRNGFYELHVSNDKEEARNAESLSRRVKQDHPDSEKVTESWYRDIIEPSEMIAIG